MRYRLMPSWSYTGLAIDDNMYFLEKKNMIIDQKLLDLPKEIQVLNNIRQPWFKNQGRDKLPEANKQDVILADHPEFEELLDKINNGYYKRLEAIEITHSLKEIEGKLCRVIKFEEVEFYILEKYYDMLNYAMTRAKAFDQELTIKVRPGAVLEFYLLLDGDVCGWFKEYLPEQITLDEALNKKHEEIRDMYRETGTRVEEGQKGRKDDNRYSEAFRNIQKICDAPESGIEKMTLEVDGNRMVIAEKKVEELELSAPREEEIQGEVEFPEPSEDLITFDGKDPNEISDIVFSDHEGRDVQYIERLYEAGLRVGIILEDMNQIFWITDDIDDGSDGIEQFKTKKALNELIQEINGLYGVNEKYQKTILLIPYFYHKQKGYTFRTQTDRKKANDAGLTVYRDGTNGVYYTDIETGHWHKYIENNHELRLVNESECITEYFLFTEPEVDGDRVVIAEKKKEEELELSAPREEEIQGEVEFPEPSEDLITFDGKDPNEISDIVFSDHDIERLYEAGLRLGIILEDMNQIFWIKDDIDDGSNVIQVFKTKKAIKELIREIDGLDDVIPEAYTKTILLEFCTEGYRFRSQTDRRKCNAAGLTVFRESINGVTYTNSITGNWHKYNENNQRCYLRENG
jgi:hypothetical protein